MRLFAIRRLLVGSVLAIGALPALAAVDGFPLYWGHKLFPKQERLERAWDMNAKDQVVGEMSSRKGGYDGFRWSPPGHVDKVRDFRSGYDNVNLVAISDSGTAVGYGFVKSQRNRFVKRALLMRPNGERVALRHLGGPEEDSEAVDVSDAGAVGFVSVNGELLYSVRWLADGTVERLELPDRVTAINARGDIVSRLDENYSYMVTATGEAFRVPLPFVTTLNDQGVVAGRTGSELRHAPAIWSVERGLEVLPTPPQLPNASCYAEGVNRHLQVVGTCQPQHDNGRALMWLHIDGAWQMADLSWQTRDHSLVPWGTNWVVGINDAGRILVQGYFGPTMLIPARDMAAP
jgi:hypothetical protein